MFVMMADMQIHSGKEAEFEKWFSESNKVLSGLPGFISRRLFKAADGTYRVVVEHESKDTFVRMHSSPEHEEVHPKGRSFMTSDPTRKSFTLAGS